MGVAFRLATVSLCTVLIATWNVNGLRARLDYFLDWIGARKPDIVGLQELKLQEESFPHAQLEALGYRSVVYGQKSWNGVALLSRSAEFELVRRGLDGQEHFGSRLITARVGEVEVCAVYCPNGKSVEHSDYPKKLAWFDALRGHLERWHDPTKALVLCGDFNICPSELDTWDEAGHADRIFHTQAERQRFQSLLSWGLEDTFRRQHPVSREFSWWDYRGGSFHRNHGLRIDMLLATAPVVARTTGVVIDRDYRKKREGRTASDHAPVLLELGRSA